MIVKALGEHVILASSPAKAGDDIVSESGLIIGKYDQGQLPEYCEIVAIGADVPEGIVKIGDITSLPTGTIRNVPHPEVVSGNKKSSDMREKLVTTHYKNLAAVYVK